MRRGMKTRSRRGRLAVRKTRSRSRRQRKSQRKYKQQRGGNFIQGTLGVPPGAYVTKVTDPEDGSAPVLIQNEEETDVDVASAPEEVA
jgi:hypothetical protein